MSRLFHLSFYAMESGRAIGHLVAILADLKLAFAVSRPHDKFGVAFFVRRPSVVPERPRDIRAGFCDLGLVPGVAAIMADFHAANAAIAAERHAAEFGGLSDFESLCEMIAPNLRRVDSTMRRNRVTLTTPALLLVKSATVPAMQAAIGFVKELDSRQPLRILLAIKAGHNQSQRKSVTLRKQFAVHLVSDKRGWLHRFLETKCFVVAVGGAEQYRRHVRFRFHLLKQV